MPREMRFCRRCGFRLGEGVAEFTETVRLQNRNATSSRGGVRTASPPQSAHSDVHEWGAIAHGTEQRGLNQTTGQTDDRKKRGRRKRVHWIVWLILALIIASVLSGLLIPSSVRRGGRSSVTSSAPRSYVGVNQLKNADGGVTFDYVTPPGSAADQAGLVGGDIIVSFDGQPVTSASQLLKLLTSTPIGKTVDVVFIRDGETKTTKLTTVSEAENSRLDDAADNRPEGTGYIGEGTSLERVLVPGMNIYGVRLNSIRRNRPAYIAGLRDGDIVIEFDGIPTRTRRELESRIERALPDSVVKVVVIRGGERLEIPVKVGIED